MPRFEDRLVDIACIALAIFVLCLFWEGYWWHEYFKTPLNTSALIFGMYVPVGIIFAIGLQMYRQQSSVPALTLGIFSIATGVLLFFRSFIAPLPRDSLCLYWCAPFIFIAFATIGVAAMLFVLLQQAQSGKRKFFLQTACIALMQIIIMHLLRPLRPTGIHAFVEFWGVGIIAFVLALLYIQTSQRVQHPYVSLLVAVQYVVLISIGDALGYMMLELHHMETHTIAQMLFGPFHHPAGLVSGIAMLLAAAVADITATTLRWYSGVAIAATYAIVTYGLGWFSLSLDHQYSVSSLGIGICAAIIGGMCATLLSSFLRKYEI